MRSEAGGLTRGASLMAVLITLPLLTVVSHAQERWWQLPPRMATFDSFDGTFNVCRLMYRNQAFGQAADGAPTIPVLT